MVRDNLALTYNGEIYNYKNIRGRLQGLGANFSTTGDVEVLLRAWQQFETGCLEQLDGMFAFAVWNGAKAHLASDAFGEKTLYYAETSDGIVVSSELLPLVRLLDVQPDFSSERMMPYLSLGYLPAPETIYPSIKRLLPAGHIEIVEGRIGAQRQYWQPPLPQPRQGPLVPLSETEIDDIHERLTESIEGRLEADVPTCTFLSGGVDSVLVAAITAKELKRSSTCLTVGFPRGQIHDESEDARAIADHLGLDHLVMESDDEVEEVDSAYIIGMYGQPNDNISIAPVHQISKIAAGLDYRVALTGMGGDELSLGYQKNEFAYRNRNRYAVPEIIRLAAGAALGPIQHTNDKFRIFRDIFGVCDSQRFIALKNQPAIHLLRKLPAFAPWAEQMFGQEKRSFGESVHSIDLTITMPNSILVSLDLASMRASMELRTPYLNKSLFELFATFDSRALLAFGRKSSLQRIAERYVPSSYFDRPKRGFVYPQDRFLMHYAAPPKVDGVPKSISEKVWRMREQPGWRRLAVRMTIASEFAGWSGREAGATT